MDEEDKKPAVEPYYTSRDAEPPFSVFTRGEKRLIVFLVAYAGLFSPLSSFIYYPALYNISQDLNITLEMANLSITTYMIVSGVAPSILGDMADTMGRRPLFLFAILTYTVANIGLAVQRSYWALLLLRMVQSAGSSGTISFGYAVVSDIATPAERGGFVGAVLLGPNVAPSLGPVLGGIIAQYAGWPWIFWTLTILSSINLCILAIALPETARHIVGNGSIVPTRLLNKSLLNHIRAKSTPSPPIHSQHESSKTRSWIPSLKPCFKALWQKENALIMLINGLFYMAYCCVQASLSSLFITIYGFKQVYAGLIYIPFGVGCALASYTCGGVMNWEYRRVASSSNFTIDQTRGDNLLEFPIEKARLRATYFYVGVAAATITGYGWALATHTHFAVPLVIQFFIGASTTAVFNACGTLLVDVNSARPATASAAANLFRCFLAAAALAALDAIISQLGTGWTFTLITGFILLSLPMIWILQRDGKRWRQAKSDGLRQQ
ncbi:major facilitator superfamily transporter [Paraphoma chrysanthemicola]|uniref:Major facilitator superfamily transporter n=1 Tax=Paraphoma chrysanthemicola TaxID=798071 RepID=A0A8K0R033_9PLEO|nr:major facilitator superfamily transporter [Paraphoma chrysanthemicola]